THLADRDPNTLSGGELQRVILAGIIALEPDVYLLDEPTVELDPESTEAFYQVLPELARQTAGVIATTDIDHGVEVAGRVVLLHEGRVAAQGSPDQVLGAEALVLALKSTTTAQIAHAAGLPAPFPLTVDSFTRKVGR